MASFARWRPVSLALWLLLGAFICQVNCDGPPSLSDCQPHIDAKMKEMSSKNKKVKAETVADDACAQPPCYQNAPQPVSQEEAQYAAYQQEQQYRQYQQQLYEQQYQQQYQQPPPPPQYQQPPPQYQQPQVQYQQQQYQYQPQHVPAAEQGQDQGRYVEPQQQQYSPPAAVPQSQEVPAQYAAPQQHYAEPVAQPQPEPQRENQQYVAPPPPLPPQSAAAPQNQQYRQPSPAPTPESKPKLGFIDKWMTVLFGPVYFERDPKFSRPWATHPEFTKRFDKTDSDNESSKVDITPGFIGQFCNKMVSTVFTIPTQHRDPKWAEPWQTHKEHIRKADTDAKPVRHESYFKFTLLNKFIESIFGKVAAERGEKWAQPWQSHPEHKREARDAVETKKEKVDTSSVIGDTLNSFVYLIFNKPTGERNPKYAEPWQTHPELRRSVVSTEEQPAVVKQDMGPGFFGKRLNSFIYTIFPEPKVSRDSKFAEPWQTHPEHTRKKIDAVPTEKVKQEGGLFGLKFALLNAGIEAMFGKVSKERDEKWTQPWQTHPEHGNLHQEVPRSRPTPAPSHQQYQPPPPPPPTHYQPPPPQAYQPPPQAYQPPPQAHQPPPQQAYQPPPPQAYQPPPPPPPPQAPKVQEAPPPPPKAPKVQEPPPSPAPVPTSAPSPMAPAPTPKRELPASESVKKPAETRSFPAEAEKLKKESKKTHSKQTTKESKASSKKTNEKVATKKDDKKYKEEKDKERRKKIDEDTKKEKEEQKRKEERKKKEKAQQRKVKEEEKKKSEDKKKLAAKAEKEHKKARKEKDHKEGKESKTFRKEDKHRKPAEKDDMSDKKKHGQSDRSHGNRKAVPAKAPVPATPAPTREPVVDTPKAPIKQVLEEPKREAVPEKQYEEVAYPPPSTRSRDHINSILGIDDASFQAISRTAPIADATLRDLQKIYEGSIQPLENTFKYKDISNRHLSEAELYGTPLVLLLGPYSTGKSSFINYVCGIEHTKRALVTGNPPSHGAFRIVQYGDHDRNLDGTDISGHPSFSSLQKFGQNFVDQVYGKALNVPLLKKVTFVEVPGILEMRRPGERLYPFNDVAQWFIDRADLILVMFDYTKLDAGYEMEALLDQLKGREAQTRILLNKADKVPSEELIKVQGSLFWNLSPLLGVNSPPTVYAGSFASIPYRQGSAIRLFQAQEEALLHDMAKAISSRVENRISIARRHAVRVRSHAQMVDTYLSTYYRNKGFLSSKHKLAEEIVENPHAYNIYEGMSLLTNVSRYDLPDAEIYRDFFRVHNLYDFRTLRETCSFMGGCPLEKINSAISRELPELVTRHRRLVEAAELTVRLPKANMKQGMGAGYATSHQRTTA